MHPVTTMNIGKSLIHNTNTNPVIRMEKGELIWSSNPAKNRRALAARKASGE